MAFVKYKTTKIEECDKIKTTIIHSNLIGYFEVGTEVKVINIGERGYDIVDNEGNKMLEIGWKI